MKQTTTFTVLPQSVVGEATLRLSVHVGLRLEADVVDGKLTEFDDAKAWADTSLSFGVSFNGGPAVPAAIVTDPARNPALWHALFDGDAAVKAKPFPPYATLPVVSFPTKSVLDFVEQTYTQVATSSGGEHPLVSSLMQLFDPIAFTERDNGQVAELLELMEAEREQNHKRFNNFESGQATTPAHHFLALRRYYQRPGEIVELEPPTFDFHELLALVGQHPPLMRMLGLVVDLEVSSRILGGLPAAGDVQLAVGWTPLAATTAIVRPRTTYELDYPSLHFAARPRDPGELDRGHLRVGDASRFELVTIDPDGAGLKALNFASSLKRADLQDSSANNEFPPQRFTVPSLRSAGLSIVRRERAATFVPKLDFGVQTNQAIVAMSNNPASPPPEVWREDVTSGYTVDVWDGKSGEWHSVVRREGTYDFPTIDQHVPLPAFDEAPVISAPVLPADPNAKQELYLHQSLFQWVGWSLAVKAPGLPIHKNDSLTPPADEPPPDPDIPLGFTLDVPGQSLPRLRYGTEYRVRMRAVDITGGRVPFDQAVPAGDPGRVAGRKYLRWEPIPSPVFVLVSPRTEAEAVDHVVIRSDYVGPIETGAKRHIVPPKGAAQTAEEHGKFDVGNPSLVDGTAYPFITSREAKTVLDVPGAAVDPDDPGGDEAQTVYIPNDFELPWLPDPLVLGAVFRNLPGGTPVPGGDAYKFPPGPTSAWHDLRPFHISVTQPPAGGGLGPPAAPVFDPGARTLSIELPKAWVVRVPVSALPVDGALDTLGIWDWVEAAAPPNLAALRSAAQQGRHWMVEPYRILTLVHAVRRPLKTPEFTKPSPFRQLGQTYARIDDRMTFSRRSTGKVDVYGAWDEWIDTGPDAPEDEDPMTPTPVETLAFQPPLAIPGEIPDEDDDNLDVHARHEFGDTKHRVVTYRGVATTKFAEYFVQRQKHTAGGGTIPLVSPPDTVIPESLKVRDRDTGHVFALGDDYILDQGTTIKPLTIASGTPLEVTFLVPPLTRDTTGPAALRTLNIRNAARPAAPKVLYAVPTFRHPEGAPLTSSRQGGGVRVYLDRPWWSSGGGERLGAVIWTPGFLQVDPPPRLVPYVTRWGLDPLFSGGSLPARNPALAHFPLRTAEGLAVTLDELPGQTVNVAGHDVGFDFDRRLWYCDIDLETASAYTPFVRLALARFQPDSLPDAHLSRIVLADYMQLTPDRAVTVVKKLVIGRNTKPQVTVTVSGLTYMSSSAESGPGFAQAIVEQRDPARGASDELGWTQVGDPVALTPLPAQNPIVGIWTGDVTLPSAITPNTFRIVVEQYEVLQTGTSIIGKVKGRRLVYSDIVPL